MKYEVIVVILLSWLMSLTVIPAVTNFLAGEEEPEIICGGSADSAEPPEPGYSWILAVPPKQGNWPRYNLPVVAFDGKLWAVTVTAPQKQAFTSTDGVNWERFPAKAGWGERYLAAVAFFRGKMWFLGGRSGTVQSPAFHNDVWSSENGTEWTLATPNAGWTPRWNHTALVFRDKLWVIGGNGNAWPRRTYNSTADSIDDVWFSSDGIRWTQAGRAPSSPRSYRSFVVFDEKIWAVGFRTGSDVWYSPDGASWTQATADAGWGPDAFYKHPVVFDGKIWAMGGADSAGNFQNDVWSSPDGVRWEQFTLHAPWNPRATNYSLVFHSKLWIYGGKNSADDVWYLISSRTVRN